MRWPIAFAICVIPASAADWVSVKSPHIEVITDAGEKTGRELLARFETLRNIFRAAGIGDTPLPIRAFAFASESEFHQYQPDAMVDGFHRGGDRDYIAMHLGGDAHRVALHEYVHAVLSHSKIALPNWFEEGTAEFYSNVEVNNADALIGNSINTRLAVLKTEPWLDVNDLSSKDPSVTRQAIFYAESWALVHMLNLGSGLRDGMPRFVLLLSENREPQSAFREAFGETIERALSRLHGYVTLMHGVSLPMEKADPTPSRVEKLTPIAAAVARAELALHVDRPAVARALIGKIDDTGSEAEAARGAIELAEKHPEEARKHFERAIALGSRDAEMWFQYAELTHASGALEKVIEIDPDFADAQFLLGGRLTDAGRFTDAIAHLQEAVRVRPRNSFYWHALGFAQAKAGQRDEALASARRAKATASTDAQEEMAGALVAMAQERLQPPLAITTGIITPPSWQNPKGDAKIEGVLSQVDCPTDGTGFARLRVSDGTGRTIELEVRHPDKVELVNAGGVQQILSCGPQTLMVAVEYQNATRDVTRIEFRP